MSKIATDKLNDLYIYRKITDSGILLVMIYSDDTKKFYRRTFTDTQCKELTNTFDANCQELFDVFPLCMDEKSGYDFEVQALTAEFIKLSFTCREKVKKYQWNIGLMERTMEFLQNIDEFYIESESILSQENFKCDNPNKVAVEINRNTFKQIREQFDQLRNEDEAILEISRFMQNQESEKIFSAKEYLIDETDGSDAESADSNTEKSDEEIEIPQKKDKKYKKEGKRKSLDKKQKRKNKEKNLSKLSN